MFKTKTQYLNISFQINVLLDEFELNEFLLSFLASLNKSTEIATACITIVLLLATTFDSAFQSIGSTQLTSLPERHKLTFGQNGSNDSHILTRELKALTRPSVMYIQVYVDTNDKRKKGDKKK